MKVLVLPDILILNSIGYYWVKGASGHPQSVISSADYLKYCVMSVYQSKQQLTTIQHEFDSPLLALQFHVWFAIQMYYLACWVSKTDSTLYGTGIHPRLPKEFFIQKWNGHFFWHPLFDSPFQKLQNRICSRLRKDWPLTKYPSTLYFLLFFTSISLVSTRRLGFVIKLITFLESA
jgi:hypothetical protein